MACISIKIKPAQIIEQGWILPFKFTSLNVFLKDDMVFSRVTREKIAMNYLLVYNFLWNLHQLILLYFKREVFFFRTEFICQLYKHASVRSIKECLFLIE